MLSAPAQGEVYLKEEIKRLDTTLNYVFSQDTAPTLLFAPAEGPDVDDREGRETRLYGLYFHGIIHGEGYQAGYGDNAYKPALNRLIVFVDWGSNGGSPASTDLLKLSTVGSPTYPTSRSHLNLNNSKRFKVLIDEIWNTPGYKGDNTAGYTFVEPGATMDTWTKSYNLRRKGAPGDPLPGILTVYKGTGATAADISTGSIWILTNSTRTATTGKLTGVCRCYFVG